MWVRSLRAAGIRYKNKISLPKNKTPVAPTYLRSECLTFDRLRLYCRFGKPRLFLQNYGYHLNIVLFSDKRNDDDDDDRRVIFFLSVASDRVHSSFSPRPSVRSPGCCCLKGDSEGEKKRPYFTVAYVGVCVTRRSSIFRQSMNNACILYGGRPFSDAISFHSVGLLILVVAIE